MFTNLFQPKPRKTCAARMAGRAPIAHRHFHFCEKRRCFALARSLLGLIRNQPDSARALFRDKAKLINKPTTRGKFDESKKSINSLRGRRCSDVERR
jgi:hypothetical protein